MMQEQKAEAALVRWAKGHYQQTDYYGTGNSAPTVEVVSMAYDEAEQEWLAVLRVSTIEQTPTVTFWLDQQHIHIEKIEY